MAAIRTWVLLDMALAPRVLECHGGADLRQDCERWAINSHLTKRNKQRTLRVTGGAAMKPKISIVTLGVRDFAASLAFYREGLGFPTHNHTEGEEHVMFRLEGSWLSLYPRDKLAEDATVPDDGRGFSGVTLAHNVASKDEVDAVFAKAVARG